MLSKLLKYDFRALFKYWWIIALSSVGLSAVGGISLKIFLDSAITDENPLITILAFFGLIITVLGLSAFLMATEIFIYVRFYQNLFSDEGYLTFTLPVRRRDILNSKIISGLVVNFLTVLLLVADILGILIIGLDRDTLYVTYESIKLLVTGTVEFVGAWCIVYVIEAIIGLFFLSVASYLLTLICITFAAVIAKKHKVFAAIGFYYVTSAVISFVGQMAFMFGSISLAGILEKLPEGSYFGVLSLMVLSLVLCVGAIAVALYSVEHYLLDRKLNLS